ncbi:MAG: 23S rRNA (adenine(2503)-C(2))-methyltransferase RlmN [Clostridia bacterium]
MKILQDNNLDEIKKLVLEMNEPVFRAKQLFEGIYSGKSIDGITNIGAMFKEKILKEFVNEPVKIVERLEGKDGTVKLVYSLFDGNIIEGVLMNYKYGNTLCVSTQVGCRMGCKFCASTLGGLVRNLSSGEILSQVLICNKMLEGGMRDKRKITNIVLMGSGEPLDNFDNVCKFLSLVSSADGINISERNISLSTCGICEKILELADLGHSVNLTISMHAPTDEIRKGIMPIANKYSIKQVLAAAKYYFEKTGRRVIFEYALIKGVNDSDECIKEIVSKFKGFSMHFNIIPLNSVKERNLESAGRSAAYQFAEKLEKNKISATVRRTMGEDIEGACGQLRNKILKK